MSEDPFITQLRNNRGSWNVKDRSPSRPLECPRTATTWRLDPTFYEREVFHSEVSALCVATQVAGPNIGLKAIVKMRIDTGKHVQFPEEELDGLEGVPTFSDEALTELHTLKRLTELGCRVTPKLLDYKVEVQTEDDMTEGSYALYVLMEKVPGRSLINFGELSMKERNEARIAFGVAIREFYSYGYRHEDPHPRNVMWHAESKKCHIIDLEDITEREGAVRPAKVVDFSLWQLKGPGGSDADPMVASLDFRREMPDEAELRRVADETMERGLGVVKNFLFQKDKKPF